MPATNPVSELSFSALKQVKAYLRSTTGEARLNHLTLLQVRKDMAGCTDLFEAANLFVGDNQRCKHLFEKFLEYDLPMKSVFAPELTQIVQNDNKITVMKGCR